MKVYYKPIILFIIRHIYRTGRYVIYIKLVVLNPRSVYYCVAKMLLLGFIFTSCSLVYPNSKEIRIWLDGRLYYCYNKTHTHIQSRRRHQFQSSHALRFVKWRACAPAFWLLAVGRACARVGLADDINGWTLSVTSRNYSLSAVSFVFHRR